MKRCQFLLIVIISISMSTAAQAVPVRGLFYGHIDEIWEEFAPADLLAEIGVGTRFMGSFLYDGHSALAWEPNSNQAEYNGGTCSLEYTIFGKTQTYHLNGSVAAIGVVNNSDRVHNDSFYLSFIVSWSGSIAGYTPDEGDFSLADSSMTAFNDLCLPTSFDLSHFDNSRIWLGSTDPGNDFSQIFGKLDALSAQPVPEPATIFLLGGGLLAIAGMGRRSWKSGKRKSENHIL